MHIHVNSVSLFDIFSRMHHSGLTFRNYFHHIYNMPVFTALADQMGGREDKKARFLNHKSHLQRVKNLVKRLPLADSLISTRAWKTFRHRLTLHSSARQNYTFTGFLRLPSQFEALGGPVLEHLRKGGKTGELKIAVIGCSNGSEAYTVASVLKNSHPGLKFTINAFDIDRDMIKKAENAEYGREEVYNNKVITSPFINKTFEVKNDLFRIKKEIRELVNFGIADALDPGLKKISGGFDMVYAQNFILHMKRDDAKRALNNICALLKPRAALFIDGVDIDLRGKLTKRNGLDPLTYKLEEIHNEARMARAVGWPYSYWGLEPFSARRRDFARRYSTIFLK